DRLELSGKALSASVSGAAAVNEFVVDFDARLPRPGRELRFPIRGSATTLVVEDYLAHAQVDEELIEGLEGPPAVHVTLASAFANQDLWLVAGASESAHLRLGPVTLEIHDA